MDMPVKVIGGGGEEGKPWSLLYQVREKGIQCQANLRAAPKLQSNVLKISNLKSSFNSRNKLGNAAVEGD